MNKKELQAKLIESNVKIVTDNDNFYKVVYRDDNIHGLVTLDYMQEIDDEYDNPLKWDNDIWNINVDASFDELVKLFGDYVNDIYDKYSNMADFFTHVENYLDKKGYIIVPIGCYEHGMSRYFVGVGTDFDYSTTGYAYAKKDDIKRVYNVARISSKVKHDIYDMLNGIMETYTDYCNGQVFTLNAYDTLTGEPVDSLCSLYDVDDVDVYACEMIDRLKDNAKETVENVK